MILFSVFTGLMIVSVEHTDHNVPFVERSAPFQGFVVLHLQI